MRFLLPSFCLLLGAGLPKTSPPPDSLEFRVVDEQGSPSFRLVNTSPTQVSVLPVLDGSQSGWRIPRVSVEYRDATGTPVKPNPVGRCGNMNGLRASDFRPLSTGEELALHGAWLHRAPTAAVEMRLTYATTEAGRRDFGDGSPPDPTLWAALPKGSWTSAWAALPVPTSSCTPLPKQGTRCAGAAMCPVPDDNDSYLECTAGTWRRITEFPER